MGLYYQIGKFAFETGSPNDMIVNPVVIAAPGFAKQYAVVFEAVFVQPALCNVAVFFRSAGEKENNMAFVKPFVQHRHGIGVRQHRFHPFRFFIGYIIADRAVDIDQKVAHVFGQYRTDALPFLIKNFPKA